MSFTYQPTENWRELLHEKRIKMNMSYEEFAKLINISKSTLISYEDGTAVPTLTNCINLANILDMAPEDFIKIINQPTLERPPVYTIKCFDIENIPSLRNFGASPYTVIASKLWKNELNRELLCIKDNDRMMLFYFKKNHFGNNRICIVKNNHSKKHCIAKYSDKQLTDPVSGKILKNACIVAQYKRDISSYILENNTKSDLMYCIDKNYLL